ncbi:alpha/beta fold hydrolase [Nonomuraea sp. CA-218870]|uniref:alpha/beta fold hydrolase n=1 Tax=Nonomuraea sp. CA-218870 TaxID=3239998 RepID=UPI003D911C0C
MPKAGLHDGSTIEIQVHGAGPTVLLPVDPEPAEGERAEAMRAWGADPALGRSLMEGLGDRFRVAAFDYEGHVLAHPKPATLTPDNIAADLLAVADAVGAARFAYYGYSWLALSGLQLALRTDRLDALVMGGFPPVGGPYREMLAVTRATLGLAGTATGKEATPGDWSTVEVDLSDAQARQFVTLYEALQDFDDLAAQRRITCPRLCFAGSADLIEYDERWGGTRVDIAGPIVRRRAELEALGWTVAVLDGLDHAQAMQPANALPVLGPWLAARV